jgi:hypothetical protein
VRGSIGKLTYRYQAAVTYCKSVEQAAVIESVEGGHSPATLLLALPWREARRINGFEHGAHDLAEAAQLLHSKNDLARLDVRPPSAASARSSLLASRSPRCASPLPRCARAADRRCPEPTDRRHEGASSGYQGRGRDGLAAMREDVQASIEQGRAVRAAAQAQNQPIVFAHVFGSAIKGSKDGVGPGQVGFRYRLVNDGTGVALNIRHGVELCGIVREFGDGMEVRSMRPAEKLPPGGRTTSPFFTVMFPEDELPPNWHNEARAYWVSFENVFSETFKTANPHDPHQSAAFIRVEELPGPEAT